MKLCGHGDAVLGCETCVGMVRRRIRFFPLQVTRGSSGPLAIPWAIADEAWKAYHQRWRNDQSVESIAERGGFGWSEMDTLLPGWREMVLKEMT